MGWTGTPISGKLNTQELNRIVDSELQSPGKVKITDRSGWTNQEGMHRFTLTELEPDHDPDNPHRKFIVITLVQQHDRMVRTKHLDESVGPLKTDCPMRMIKQVEEYPPVNEYARKWRADVRECHRIKLEITKLLRELKADYPNGNRQIIIDRYNGEFDPETLQATKVQQEATFSQARQRRGIVNTFSLPGDNNLYRLNPDQINIKATQELRAKATA